MTGLYPHECGVGHMTHRSFGPGYLGYLNDTCVTLAEVLSYAGYFTAMAGKWHAGAVRKAWPENRGFQRYFGIHHWVDSYFNVLDDCEVFEDGEIVIPASRNPLSYSENSKEWYKTDVFTTVAIEYIDEALKAGKPFFQYVAYNAPHWPLEAHDEVIATPLIVHWPEGIKNPGSLDDEPGHLVDIMATCIELAGAEYPAERNGVRLKSPRGVSMTDNFKGERGREHDMIFWEHEGHGALRKGDWKIVTVDPYDENLWELYNMKDDRTETNDLSEEKPELRVELIDLWIKMAYETKAWPKGEESTPNPVDK